MKELALHILDIAQNSVHARADRIEIHIEEQKENNRLRIQVNDNGKGMDKKTLEKANDPFFTTGKKKTGLGIPLLRQHAEATGGSLHIHSAPGKGTQVKAEFVAGHIDLQPMGDLPLTISGLIRGFPEIHWIYTHNTEQKEFRLDTSEIQNELDGIPLNTPEVIRFLQALIKENLEALSKD